MRLHALDYVWFLYCCASGALVGQLCRGQPGLTFAAATTVLVCVNLAIYFRIVKPPAND